MGGKPRKRTQRIVYTATGWLPKDETIAETLREGGMTCGAQPNPADRLLFVERIMYPDERDTVRRVRATVTIKIEDL